MSNTTAHRRAYGQFFTPEPVVACCYALLAGCLPPNSRVADPACGDGAFLRYAATHGLAAVQNLYGCDLDASLVGALVADGLPQIRHADGLDRSSLPAASFDLVIGNPPFGVVTSLDAKRRLASEALFLLRALELAGPGRYIGLVLPSGVLANERLRTVRADILRCCTLLAVIALPRATFRSAGTNAACSIVLLQKAAAQPDHRVFFALAQDLDDLPSFAGAYYDRQPLRLRSQWWCQPVLPIIDDSFDPFDTRPLRCLPRSLPVGGLPRGQPKGRAGRAAPEAPPEETPHTGLVAAPGEGPGRRQPAAYWLPQTTALAQRMDAHFWRPEYRQILELLAARHPLLPLGELIERRRNPAACPEQGRRGWKGRLIVGDHVRPSHGETKGAGLPYEYYQTREFLVAGYNYATIERCDERTYQRLKYTAVQPHDILVSCAGIGGAGQGRVCLITHRPGPSCTGDVFILRVFQPDWAVFLALFLGSRGGRTQLLRLQNGVGTTNLSADELLQVEVPLVPAATHYGFAARYAPIAAAHEVAMAALAGGDILGFQHARSRSEALLAVLKHELDAMLLAVDITTPASTADPPALV